MTHEKKTEVLIVRMGDTSSEVLLNGNGETLVHALAVALVNIAEAVKKNVPDAPPLPRMVHDISRVVGATACSIAEARSGTGKKESGLILH